MILATYFKRAKKQIFYYLKSLNIEFWYTRIRNEFLLSSRRLMSLNSKNSPVLYDMWPNPQWIYMASFASSSPSFFFVIPVPQCCPFIFEVLMYIEFIFVFSHCLMLYMASISYRWTLSYLYLGNRESKSALELNYTLFDRSGIHSPLQPLTP